MEDDINICYKFKSQLYKFINTKNKNDFTFFGYSMYSRNRQTSTPHINEPDIIEFRRNMYVGGFFCYAITKFGAEKIISYISQNGIDEAIDCVVKCPGLNCVEIFPQLVHTEWNELGKKIDTDIQNNYESIEASECLINKYYVFIPNKDQNGYDISHEPRLSLNQIALRCLHDKTAIGFNTYKWIKHSLVDISEPSWFTGDHGIYIKKDAYLKYMNESSNKDIELVSTQCNVSREKAQETLVKNNGDILQSIIEMMTDI